MNLSRHAEARLQQRGIPYEAVDAIMCYGSRRRRHGADIYFVDKKSRRSMAQALGTKAYSKLERSLNSYLVVGENGSIITAAHRIGRLKF